MFSVSKEYDFLTNHTKSVNSISTKNIKSMVLLLNLVSKIIFELIFRLCSVTLITFKISNLIQIYF